MKIAKKVIWILILGFITYGLLPVTIPDSSYEFDNPNVIQIHWQECGCSCPDAYIEKGFLFFEDELLEKHPDLIEHDRQVNIYNFPFFDHYNYDFMTFNSFILTGEVVGVDTILCNPNHCVIAPRFYVEDWALGSYYCKFWIFERYVGFLYIFTWIIFLLSIPSLVWKAYKKIRKKWN